MEKLGSNKAPIGLRKDKKKQVKDEVDRLKQAEKKRRRLEKALATSAAIRSELEKKKMKKMEEQQRLDEECAATAEAVALHVLVGEDTEESFQIRANSSNTFSFLDNSGHFMDHHSAAKFSIGEIGRFSYAYASRNEWNGWANGVPFSSGLNGRDLYVPCYDGLETDAAEDSAGLIAAAHAVSSLCISENSPNLFPGQQNTETTVINRKAPGHDFDRKFSLFKYF